MGPSHRPKQCPRHRQRVPLARRPSLPYANAKPVESRHFTIGGHCWCISYYRDAIDECISFRLFLAEDTTSNPVRAHCEFSLVDETARHVSFTPAPRIHRRKIHEFRGRDGGCEKFAKRQFINMNINRDDSFTFRCDVWVAPEDVIKTIASPFMAVPPSDMQQNFISLLQSQEGTNVVFRVRGERFAAHRCVLAAHSSVFRSMLFGPKKEGTSSTASDVQIEDMDAAVFKAVLGFIYGDSLTMPSVVKDEGALLQHLLVAADRYDLRRLKLMCANKLCAHIGMDTAKTILALGEKHRCDGLQKACNDFLHVSRT
jgi:speckle-type POZ protein